MRRRTREHGRGYCWWHGRTEGSCMALDERPERLRGCHWSRCVGWSAPTTPPRAARYGHGRTPPMREPPLPPCTVLLRSTVRPIADTPICGCAPQVLVSRKRAVPTHPPNPPNPGHLARQPRASRQRPRTRRGPRARHGAAGGGGGGAAGGALAGAAGGGGDGRAATAQPPAVAGEREADGLTAGRNRVGVVVASGPAGDPPGRFVAKVLGSAAPARVPHAHQGKTRPPHALLRTGSAWLLASSRVRQVMASIAVLDVATRDSRRCCDAILNGTGIASLLQFIR